MDNDFSNFYQENSSRPVCIGAPRSTKMRIPQGAEPLWRGNGGVPHLLSISPKIGGQRG